MALVFVIGLVLSASGADTFNLTSGESIVGDLLVTSANDVDVQVKVGEGEYKRVAWATFSQDDLKKLAQNPKLQAFAEPFIQVTLEERLQRTEVKTTPPPKLKLHEKRSLFSAMFTAPLGIFLILVLYLANIYAGYEVAIFRGHSVPMVCGASALVPLIGPLVFLSMKTKMATEEQQAAEEAAAGAAPAAAGTGAPATPTRATAAPAASAQSRPAPSVDEDDDNPMHATGAAPSSLHISHEEPAKPKHPPTTTYQRGQFTFNRRFFETRFPGMFGVVKRDADKDMVLVIKAARGEFTGTRISRIAASDLHLQVEKGGATEEVLIPFTEIQEIRHKHKDA